MKNLKPILLLCISLAFFACEDKKKETLSETKSEVKKPTFLRKLNAPSEPPNSTNSSKSTSSTTPKKVLRFLFLHSHPPHPLTLSPSSPLPPIPPSLQQTHPKSGKRPSFHKVYNKCLI